MIPLPVYVDDIIVTGNNEEGKWSLKRSSEKEFDIKELGKLKHFLGIEVANSKKRMFISQQKYVLDSLKEPKKQGYKPIDTPIKFNHRFCDAPDDKAVDKTCYL